MSKQWGLYRLTCLPATAGRAHISSAVLRKEIQREVLEMSYLLDAVSKQSLYTFTLTHVQLHTYQPDTDIGGSFWDDPPSPCFFFLEPFCFAFSQKTCLRKYMKMATVRVKIFAKINKY
jgi:hypothetical protein